MRRRVASRQSTQSIGYATTTTLTRTDSTKRHLRSIHVRMLHDGRRVSTYSPQTIITPEQKLPPIIYPLIKCGVCSVYRTERQSVILKEKSSRKANPCDSEGLVYLLLFYFRRTNIFTLKLTKVSLKLLSIGRCLPNINRF